MNNNTLLKTCLTFIIVITVCFSIQALAQNPDSLETVLRTNKKLTVKEQLKLYDNLSWDYINVNVNKAKLLALQGIELSRKTKNDKMCGILYHHIGIACYNYGEMDSAWFYFKKAEIFAKKANDDFRLDRIYIAYAILYDSQNEYEKAINVLMNLLPKLEKRKDGDLIRTAYGNLGTLYLYIHNYKLSEKYYRLCEEASIEAKDDWKLSQACNGLIDIYIEKKDYEKALEYTDKALLVAKRCDDYECQALTYKKKSEIYYTHFKDFNKAQEFGLKGLKVAKGKTNQSDISELLINLSNISYRKNEFKQSMDYALEALHTDTTDQSVYENIAANIVKSGIYLNDKENAIKYFNKYYEIVETRSEKELHRFAIDSEKKYQTEKKDLKIKSLEKQRRMYWIIGIAVILSLLALILSLYFRQKTIKTKKELAEHKVIQLEQEKQLVATQAILDGETAERTRLARDLHDGLGGMLSAVKLNLFYMKKDVVLDSDDVSRFNKVLEMLDNSIQELRRVAHNMMPESLSRYGLKIALEDFCNSFNNVKFHFFGTEKRVEKTLETTIYRAVHEFVNNAVKHAEADLINVQLIQQEDGISVNVQDNGKGFDPENSFDGHGLQNIRNRVNSVGGTINIFSSPENGTEISIDINLSQENGKN